jgi:hypothetical protein
MGVLAGDGNLDPAMRALFTFLRHRKIDGAAGSEAIGQIGGEDELLVVLVEKLAGPDNLLHAFGQLAAIVFVRLRVGRGDSVERPAGLRHRLDRDDAFGNLHANLECGRALASMADFHNPLVGAADGGLFGLKCCMRICACGPRAHGGGD